MKALCPLGAQGPTPKFYKNVKSFFYMLYGFRSKFYNLSSSESRLKIGEVLAKIQKVKPSTFWDTVYLLYVTYIHLIT